MVAAHLLSSRTRMPKKLGSNPSPKKATSLEAKSNTSITAKATPNSTRVHYIDDRYTGGAKWLKQDRVSYQFKFKAKGPKSEFRVCSMLIDTKRKRSRTVATESARLSGKSSAFSEFKITPKLDKYHDRWGSERRLVTYLVVRNRSKKTPLSYEVSLRRSKPKSVAKPSAPKKSTTIKKDTTVVNKQTKSTDPQPDKLTLAKIAAAAYDSDFLMATNKDCKAPNTCMPAGYRYFVDGVRAMPYLGKFQSVAVLNKNTKTPTLVIAYRGTWSTGSLHTDVGLFEATVVDSSCVRNALKAVARLCPMPKNYSDNKMKPFKCISNNLKTWGAAKCNLEIRKVAEVLAFGERFYTGALREAKKALNGKTPKVYVTGHSLGGYIATYVAAKNNVEASVFNAPPGARYALLSSRSNASTFDQKVNNKIVNYRINDDVVSSFAGWNRKGTPLGHTGRVCTYPGPNMQTKLKTSIMDMVNAYGATIFSSKARNSALDFFATGLKLTSHKMTTVIAKIQKNAAGTPECADAPANRYFY
jgi:putative lipase involved disintegration of autophagic bodies